MRGLSLKITSGTVGYCHLLSKQSGIKAGTFTGLAGIVRAL